MNLGYYGKVLFANGKAAEGVSVRIFDRDEPGKGDDDLTIEPGLSDNSGDFEVRYSPSRYLDSKIIHLSGRLSHLYEWATDSTIIRIPDLSDDFQPYLKMDYSFAGQSRVYTAPFSPFKNVIHLPEVLPLDFLPSQHGFRFVNSFPGSPLPFNIPSLPGANKVSAIYGLCGGMASGAYDFYLAGCDIPDCNKSEIVPPPSKRTKLHKYLFRRLIDSFGFGIPIIKLAQWMTMTQDGPQGIQKRTYDEFEFGEAGDDSRSIRAKLDAQEAVQLGLLYEKANNWEELLQKIWNNHQVLAIGYTDLPGGDIEIHIYDPNYPLRDDIVIHAKKVITGSQTSPRGISDPVYGYETVQKRRNQVLREVFGFFPMPYSAVEPAGIPRRAT